jgi:hypothetical protein
MRTWLALCPQPALGPPPLPRPRRREVCRTLTLVQALGRGGGGRRRGVAQWYPIGTTLSCCQCTWEQVTKSLSLAGKSKKEDSVKEEKRKRDTSTQPPKSSKPLAGGKSSQQPTGAQPAPPGQPQQGSFVAHKEIKLTLLNKVRPRAYCGLIPSTQEVHPAPDPK